MQQLLDGQYEVFGAMRYGKPPLIEMLKRIKKGSQKVVINAPSFVADCLETIVELE